MLTEQQLSNANTYGDLLQELVHECLLPHNNRVRASVSCLSIAQDHHHAIVVLFSERLYASSLALIRVLFEAYVRGLWLVYCASENEVEAFIKGNKPPKINDMLCALDGVPALSEWKIFLLKNKMWKSLCAFNHTDGEHVLYWNNAEFIEPIYPEEKLIAIFELSEILASFSVLEIINLANNFDIKDKFKSAFENRLARLS